MKLKLFRYFFVFTLFFVSCMRVVSMGDFSIINENFNRGEIVGKSFLRMILTK